MATFPDVVLRTERLTLRPYTEADVAALHEAGADPQTQRWLPLPTPYTPEHARGWALEVTPETRTSGRGLARAVELDGRLVAGLDLKRTDWVAKVTEIGYFTHPSYRGRGVIPEASSGSSCASRRATARASGWPRRRASREREQRATRATCTGAGWTW